MGSCNQVGWCRVILLVTVGSVTGATFRAHASEPAAEGESAAVEVYSQWPVDRETAAARQRQTAEALDAPLELENTCGATLRLVPAGEFMMGTPQGQANGNRDEQPAHRVRITRPFYLGKYEVTRGEFRQFVDATDYKTDAEKDSRGGWGYTHNDSRPFRQAPEFNWRATGFEQTDEHPVVNVSWNDAKAYCEWLSKQEEAIYRLPTEAEWEYACRSGTDTPWHHGNDADGVVRAGNVSDAAFNAKFAEWMKRSKVDREKMGSDSPDDDYVFTAPVGRFEPNAFGLYDMQGNVWEWCADWDDANYYQGSPRDDPQGPSTGTSRIRRGGSWLHSPTFSRSAQRRRYAPEKRNSPIGFRVAKEVVPRESN